MTAEQPRLDVTLYTRVNCSLCDDAAGELEALRNQLRYSVTIVDVDVDDALREQYGEIVPVIAVAGRIIAHAPIAPGELRTALINAIG